MTVISINSDDPEEIKQALEDVIANLHETNFITTVPCGVTVDYQRDLMPLNDNDGHYLSQILHFNQWDRVIPSERL